MIELTKIYKVFYAGDIETYALNNIDLKIKKGEFVSIMGPSGCGKSTLLNIIGLLDKASRGNLSIDNIEITPLMPDRKLASLRNHKLGFIFQSFHLIPALNVIDNTMLPLLYRDELTEKERFNLAVQVLDKVGLSHRMKHFPSQLSGGQCQRVAIARAIIGNPKIILADEPTGNLDTKMGQEILDLLLKLNAEGATIVMVTHDEYTAKSTNRIIRMLDGKLI